MSTNTDKPTDESPDSFVEVYSTTLNWQDGRIYQIKTTVEYYGPGGGCVKNTVIFGVNESGEARLNGFERPVNTVQDLRVIPAAEMVARSVDGVTDAHAGFHVLEDEIEAGHQAVDNRLEMNNVPRDLEAGYNSRMEEKDA